MALNGNPNAVLPLFYTENYRCSLFQFEGSMFLTNALVNPFTKMADQLFRRFERREEGYLKFAANGFYLTRALWHLSTVGDLRDMTHDLGFIRKVKFGGYDESFVQELVNEARRNKGWEFSKTREAAQREVNYVLVQCLKNA
jgi:hypothetical protein